MRSGSLSWERLLAVARKEAIQLRRDTRSLLMAFLLPAILVLIFGYAISFDVNDIPFAVYDGDGSAASRGLADAFRSSGYFSLTGRLDRHGEADRLLQRGEVRLVLVIPANFSTRLGAGQTVAVQALVDGGDANTASIALNYAQAVVAAYSAGVRLAAGGPAGQSAPPAVRVWYNETLNSRWTIVPGLVAVIMMIIAAMLTSLTIAREWERGSMEQLAATPVHRLEVIGGKLLPYLAIGMFDVAVTVLMGVTIFQVPLRGSLILLLGASLLFLLGGLGLGVFISAVAKSQLLATQMSMLATYLPGFLLSGFAFDIANMPKVLQVVSLVVPARYFIVITRGVFLKGVGPGVLWPEVLALGLYATIGLALAVRTFKKEIAP
jgi:ABC-2 type transport system permease protein